MTSDKFISELDTLKLFFTTFCKSKHKNQKKFSFIINYNEQDIEIEYTLCEDCNKLIHYSIDRLQECQHDPKPRCRKCPNPCYEKVQWKKLAKVMRYSGLQLGFLKIKNMFGFNKGK